MKNKQASLFERFDRHPLIYSWVALSIYIFVNNSINVFSKITESTRNQRIPTFEIWEPFVWEYTSAFSIVLLLPLLYWWFSRSHRNFANIPSWLAQQALASVTYSVLHVGLMIVMRQMIYSLAGANYDFGDTVTEFIYEYRKDFMAFNWFMGVYYAFTLIYERLKGEANLIQEADNAESTESVKSVENAETPKHSPTSTASPQYFLVKKLDKEFIVKTSDIEWLESVGNYVNLHVNGRIYPLRSTLSGLLERLSEQGFVQTHRSFGVNLSFVASVSPLPSGDGEIHMKNAKTLGLSRRYRENFKQRLI
ncbi:LytR/AlgR family response regulator transcription factor [Agaribacter flavus]|uniref:LytR/AlgR family response regulator transcription factor n=1 Tax=Agaribacter flavus TaxID=1902781 RepID=A0ABV7FIQ8_9ALTE